MRKVLFATYPMAFHTPGGGEVQLLAYKRYLEAAGLEITLFNPWQPEFLRHDLVHFFSCVGGSSHFCEFVKKLGLPLVVSSSLWITEATRHEYPMDEIRFQLGLADRIVTNSSMESQTLASVTALPIDRFRVVYNGVDPEFYEPADPTLFRQEFSIHEPFVLNVGNIEPRKNQLRLVEAMKAFPERPLVLIGHTRDPAYLQQILRHGGPQVRFLGPLPHDSAILRSAFAACSLFALPSALETPGLAALEACAQRAALLLTEVGSCREYFEDRAVYVDPFSVKSIQSGIATCLSDCVVPAAPHTGDFRWPEVVRSLSNIYEELVTR